VKVLIDENLSPSLVARFADRGVAARHIVHVGKRGLSDPDLWRLAFDHDEVVLTINAGDFLQLAAGVELHPGLVVLRSQGLTRDEQWTWIQPVFDHVIEKRLDLTNTVAEVRGPGLFSFRKVPTE
jgi:predicted nuclease of predicted toxin-antitoxin system